MTLSTNLFGTYPLEYAPDDTFNALVTALGRSDQFFIQETDQSSLTLAVQTSISWKSWGENLFITVIPTETGTSIVEINSSSKLAFIDWGKNQDNLNRIIDLVRSSLGGS